MVKGENWRRRVGQRYGDRLNGRRYGSLRRRDGNDHFNNFSAAQDHKHDLSGPTASNILKNAATLSDGHVLTAQVGYLWTAADFI